MKNFALISILVFLSLFGIPSQAFADDPAQDFTLSNGLKVIFLPITDNQVVSLSLVMPGTSLRQTEDNSGIEEILFSVMNRGSSNYPGDEVHKALDKYGSTIYHSVGKDFSKFSMSAVLPFFAQTLDVFADAWLKPELTEKEIELAKQKQLSYLRARVNNPDEYLPIVLNSLYYKGHPYANDIEGTEKSIQSLNREQLLKQHQMLLDSGDSFLVVVGNLDKQYLKEKLEEHFGKTARKQYLNLSLPAFLKGDKHFTSFESNLPTHYILGKFDIPPINDEDYASVKMGLKILSQRLWEEIRTKRGLTYAVTSAAASSATNYGYVYLNTTNIPKSMSVIFTEFDKIKNEDIDPKELKASKAVYKTQYFMSIEPNSSQAAYLALGEIYLGDYKKRNYIMDQIEKTTPQSVKLAMRKYLKNITFAVIGTADKTDQNLFNYTPRLND